MKYFMILLILLLIALDNDQRPPDHRCHWLTNFAERPSTFICKTKSNSYHHRDCSVSARGDDCTIVIPVCAWNIQNVVIPFIIAATVAFIVAHTRLHYDKHGGQNRRREYEDVVNKYPVQCTEDP